jgi:hypothetical protein
MAAVRGGDPSSVDIAVDISLSSGFCDYNVGIAVGMV